MKAKRTFVVKILTKPYLKKYMHSLYGEKIVFSTTNQFGTILMALLDRPSIISESKEKIKMRLDHYSTPLDLFCPLWFLRENKYGYNLSDGHIITINKFIDQKFTEDLFKFCLILKIVGVPIEDSLEEFCKVHGIEIDEDITLDALKKKEYRYRKHLIDIGAGIGNKNPKPMQISFF